MRILVADDEEAVRLICRVNLQAEGIEVVEAINGEQAFERALATTPDAALLDVMMPILDGWQVAARLRAHEQTADIPLIFMTAKIGEEPWRLAESFAASLVTKPFDPVGLARHLRSGLNSRVALPRPLLDGDLDSKRTRPTGA